MELHSTPTQDSQGHNIWHAPFRRLSRQQIRLLCLEPGQFDDEVRCSLIHANPLTEQFEALSYTWADDGGDKSACESIVLDGYCHDGRFLVTRNCLAALKTIRHDPTEFLEPPVARRVWVDSICIFQDDVAERTQQVSMMAEVYRRAESVLAYIGNRVHNLDKIVEKLEDIGKWGSYQGYKTEGQQLLHAFFTDHAYFSRLWVVQEVVLAKSLKLFMAGHHVIIQSAFGSRSVLGQAAERAGFPIWLRNVNRMVKEARRGRSLQLWEYVYSTADINCSDPRDRIYALLGMHSNPSAGSILRPDYSLSKAQVATRSTAYMICEEMTDEILACAAGPGGLLKGLPSWAVDFDALIHWNDRFPISTLVRERDKLAWSPVKYQYMRRMIPDFYLNGPHIASWFIAWHSAERALKPTERPIFDEKRSRLSLFGRILSGVGSSRRALASEHEAYHEEDEEDYEEDHEADFPWWEVNIGQPWSEPSTIYFRTSADYKPTDNDFIFAPDFDIKMTLLIRGQDSHEHLSECLVLQESRVALKLWPSQTLRRHFDRSLNPVFIADSYKRYAETAMEEYIRTLDHVCITIK